MSTVITRRPRIWLTPAIISGLKQKTNSAAWQALISACNGGWDSLSPYFVHGLNYALVYQVTGDNKYADKAISYVQTFIDNGMEAIKTPGQRDGYNSRYMFPEVAATYDWCWDRLTVAQRMQWRKQMLDWADAIWGDNSRWSHDNPGDNFFHGYLMTALIGYATAEEDPRGQKHVDLARQKWTQMVQPYVKKFGGYCSLEGTNYGTWRNHFYYMAAHATATGENDFADAAFTFPKEAVIGRVHLSSPTMTYLAPLGEQTRVKEAPISDDHLTMMRIATTYGDNETASMARWWLDNLFPVPFETDWRWTPWEKVLWDNKGIVGATPASTSLVDSRSGFWSARSGWGRDAFWICGTNGPTVESHQDRGVGQFMIWADGKWQTVPARFYGGRGLFTDTGSLNEVLVDGQGQPMPNQDSPAHVAAKLAPAIKKSAIDEAYFYIKTSGQDAYSTYKWSPSLAATPVLKEWTREILWVKKNVCLIRDTIETASPSGNIECIFQSKEEPRLDINFSYTLAGGTLFGETLPKCDMIKSPIITDGEGTTSWRLAVKGQASPKTQMLNVLSTSPVVKNSRSWIGAKGILCGPILALFADVPSDNLSLKLIGDANRVVIAGLDPGSVVVTLPNSKLGVTMIVGDAGILDISLDSATSGVLSVVRGNVVSNPPDPVDPPEPVHPPAASGKISGEFTGTIMVDGVSRSVKITVTG